MQQQQFEKLVEETLAKCREQALRGDHGDNDDRLASFKRSADLTGCTALQVALLGAGPHFDAIASYVRELSRGDAQEPDAIAGRLDELITACLLMKGLLIDSRDDDRSRLRVAEQRLAAARTSAIQRQAEVVASPEPVLKAER